METATALAADELNLSRRLVADMQQQKYTAYRLADESGVPYTRIWEMMHGTRIALSDPRNRMALRKLARAMGYADATRYEPPINLNGSFGRQIKVLRAAMDPPLTQSMLAAAADIPIGTISRLEADDTYIPGPEVRAKLARVLGFDLRGDD